MFQEGPFIKPLLAEARKRVRKMIFVSHQVEPFKGLGLILKVQRQVGNSF